MTVEVSRRSILIGGMAVLATALPVPAMALRLHALDSNSDKLNEGEKSMATITTKDGTQMLFFLANGYRVVAHDRRGHGRSSQVGTGHDMDHYASDASAVAEHLDLKNAIHVGHSTGGGEVARYVAKYGEPQRRVAKAVLISAVPPLMVKTEKNPGGTPIEVFDGFRKALADNRAQFYIDVPSGPFYGFNRAGAKVSQGVIQNWWRQGMMGGALAQYEGIKAFSRRTKRTICKRLR